MTVDGTHMDASGATLSTTALAAIARGLPEPAKSELCSQRIQTGSHGTQASWPHFCTSWGRRQCDVALRRDAADRGGPGGQSGDRARIACGQGQPQREALKGRYRVRVEFASGEDGPKLIGLVL
jgi:hypothetical protein